LLVDTGYFKFFLNNSDLCNLHASTSVFNIRHVIMKDERLKYLIQSCLVQSLTEEESLELDNFMQSNPALDRSLEQPENKEVLDKAIRGMASIDVEGNVQKVLDRIHLQGSRKPMVRMRSRWAIAASIVFFLSVAIYFIWPKISSVKPVEKAASLPVADIAPGGNKAILTLGHGQKIDLDSVPIGNVADEGGAKIVKSNNGTLSYTSLRSGLQANYENPGPISYNTLETPRAGQYKVTLSDGSKVWLNNISSLRYPLVFTGKSREVELRGEAYFEVRRDSKKPFRVHVTRNGQDMTIDVLGTHFNVSAYSDDENIKTTLLAGTVSVSSGEHAELMKPGEQITTGRTVAWQRQNMEHPDEVIAWTKGQFHFSNDNLPDVLRQLERWYAVKAELRIHDHLSQYSFNGFIDRTKNLSFIYKTLSYGKDIKFLLEGKKLIVTR